MARHIFIDNSNIYGGAQRAAETCEPSAVWLAVRVYFKNLVALLEGKDVVTRVMAGSVPPGNEELWQAARDLGYDTDLLRRVEKDDGRLGEQAVDEMLHLKIANAILDHSAPQTLVIASGDGKVSKWNTSFPQQAERALRAGWSVEVWSWQAQHTTKYGPISRKYPGKVTQSFLDPYYRGLTFTKAGTYNINGTSIKLAGRVVGRLRPAASTPATMTIEGPKVA
jgi:hypothetical protein